MEFQREKLYEWLGRHFASLEDQLDEYEATELDGKLWALSGMLIDIGMWKAFEIELLLGEKSSLQMP